MIRVRRDAQKSHPPQPKSLSASDTSAKTSRIAENTVVLNEQDVEVLRHECQIAGRDGIDARDTIQRTVENLASKNRDVVGQLADDEAVPAEQCHTSKIIEGCRAWMSSMVVHVLAIIVLALLTMDLPLSQPVSLTMGIDEFTDLSSSLEVTIDTSKWEVEAQESVSEELPPELLEIQQMSEIEKNENVDAYEDFLPENPLGADSQASSSVLARQTAVAGSPASASFFGIEAQGQRIVYIVDRSGSMSGQRWFNASQELVKSLEQLKPDQKFFVYLFSKRCHPMPRLSGRGNLVPATKQNVKEVKKWLLRQIPDENTNPMSSVRQALRQNPDTIFLLTDGKFMDNTGQYLVNRAEMRKNTSQSPQVVINTIAFHCDHLDFIMMLRSIALSYSGTFRHIE